MTTTSTRPALYQYRDGEIRATYEPANPHPVPIPAADVLEAVRFLRGTLSYYETLDADLLAGMGPHFALVAEGLRILYRGAADWDMQTAHIPFRDVWTVVEAIQDVTEWTREGIEVRPGGYKEVADEIALTHRLTLALDAYDVATYAITDEEATAETQEAPTADREAPEPAEEPPHAVEAFWSLAQYFQSKGVNTEQVAHAAVNAMTPAT